MPVSLRTKIAAALALGAFASPLLASAVSPADTVRSRIAAYRELGASFKGVNDALRESELQTVVLAQYARQIRNYSRQQYNWFPAGSDARAGVRTAVKPEVWSKPAQFRAAQDGFAQRADAFQRAVSGGDAAAIRTAARSLGGTCKTCHDQFRVPQD